MRAVIQRVKQASVKVDGKIVGEIDKGFVVLLGITHEDTTKDVDTLINKMIHLRIFEDEHNKMNVSLVDVKGSILSISQFTLYADVKKGRRPSFINAAHPDYALDLYEYFNTQLRNQSIYVETGKFGEMMDVELINEGPVTIMIETKQGKIVDTL